MKEVLARLDELEKSVLGRIRDLENGLQDLENSFQSLEQSFRSADSANDVQMQGLSNHLDHLEKCIKALSPGAISKA